ncbi:MAG TPA: class I SAM-dependent methyltransferase [Vicinamibacterales bacterium]|jgi:SAM-dependent methyltransferase|nr:class I SAM-dependent methyltransferase [Vicinamibacterales bacterium]
MTLMNLPRAVSRLLMSLLLVPVLAGLVHAQTATQQAPATKEEFKPVVGQAGKDVVWVPTPQVVTDRMLDVAKITPQDFVVDLGSGDGRNIITAAKRGARGRGVEFNPEMVALSRRTAEKEGVADRATFVEGDMFAAEFNDATVLALFLLPANLDKLRDKFLALKPGTRIVANTFWIDGWEPDFRDQLSDTECTEWCNVMLFIVPARVDGAWRLPQGELAIKQSFQKFTGTLTESGRVTSITDGKLNGDEITFTAGTFKYSGRVNGDRIEGTSTPGGPFSATRAK